MKEAINEKGVGQELEEILTNIHIPDQQTDMNTPSLGNEEMLAETKLKEKEAEEGKVEETLEVLVTAGVTGESELIVNMNSDNKLINEK